MGDVVANIIIQPLQRIILYQKIERKVAELRLLGMTYKEIAKSLNVTRNTAMKADRRRKNQ
jgi:orotate phosphoribosyltransferase-like protein